MPRQTTIRWIAVGVLAIVCAILAFFEIQAARGRLIGSHWSGELFILIIRQDGGALDFAKQAMLPILTGATIASKFYPKRDGATLALWAFLGLYLLLTIVFFFQFQLRSIAEEIWVNDGRETFIRDPEDVAANQEAFEDAVRFFCYQSIVGIMTYALVLLGIRPRERSAEGGV